MLSKQWLAAGVGIIAASWTLAADDTYLIKIKERGKGSTINVKRSDTIDAWTKILNPSSGKVIEEEHVKDQNNFVFWEQLLERDARGPTKLRRGYGTARTQSNDDKSVYGFEGKLVLIEKDKKTGAYGFRREDGKTLDDDDATFFEIEFNAYSDTILGSASLPVKPVALKQIWQLKADQWIKDVERYIDDFEIDKSKSTALGQLTKVFEKDGRQYGVLLLHVELPVRVYKEGKKRIPLKGAKLVFQETHEACIDGSFYDDLVKGTSDFRYKEPFEDDDGNKSILDTVVRWTFEHHFKEPDQKK